MFKFSVRIRWHVPHVRPDLPPITELVLRRSLLTVFQSFFTFSSVQLVEERPKRLIFTEVFPFESRKPLKSQYSSQGIVTES